MAVSRRKKARRNGRPRIVGPKLPPQPPPAVLSLPPAPGDETPQVASDTPQKWTERPPKGHPDRSWWLPENSEVRNTAMQIIAMRISGMEDQAIADALKISKNSISPYVYRAGRNGWLDLSYDPKSHIQYSMMHRVVRNLDEGLDSKATLQTGMPVRTQVALKIAESTVFKEFGDAKGGEAPQTVVAVQIVMPDGPRQTMREDTTGGTPAYLDAEVAT